MTHRLLALVPALAAVLALAAPASASTPSCLRGGATLQTADGPVRVVRLARRPTGNQTRVVSIVACWAPTGRRSTIVRETDLGDDLRTSSRVEIVGRRWVGMIVRYEGGVTETIRSSVHDARTGRRVHDSAACDAERGDRSGIDDAVFLPGGGMAMACNRLLLFPAASSTVAQELEPAGTMARRLAVARNDLDFRSRLYWTVLAGEGESVRSVDLAG